MAISEIIMETLTLGTAIDLNTTHNASLYASVNSSCAQTPPPAATARHFPALSVPGWGICKFCAARGPGICQPRGQSRGIDMQAVSYQNITIYKVVKACSWFYVCISSLLITPELQGEIGSYRRKSTCFGYWIKFLLILFKNHSFLFINLFIT